MARLQTSSDFQYKRNGKSTPGIGKTGGSDLAPLEGEVIVLTRRQSINQLSKDIPLNDYNLPKYLYRTDMIPPDILSRVQSEREQILTAAVITINYDEGYPAFENGHPIWDKMIFESSDEHTLFQHYLKQTENGVRQIHLIATDIPGINPDALLDHFHMNYWKFRAKAFDLFLIAMHEKKRLIRLMACEDDHYIMADTLLKQCKKYFEDPEVWQDLDPGTVARMIPQLATLQRQALGAAAQGGGGPAGGVNSGAKSVEVILRQLTADDVQESTAHVGESKSIATLLNDPEAAEVAQELIVKLNAS